jgi:hypothetical protein
MTTISLLIPEHMDWPLEGRDPATGDLLLREGFLEAVADASGLALSHDGSARPVLTEEMVSALLVQWYRARLTAGLAPCPIMDALIEEAMREALH